MPDINITALVKGDERYLLIFADDRKTEALRTLGKWACDAELSFTWYDAAEMAKRIGEGVKTNE